MDSKPIEAALNAVLACGPRAPGSPGEARAAERIAGLFRAAGIETRVEPFAVSRLPFLVGGTAAPLAAASIIVLASVLAPHRPGWSALVLAVLLAGIVVVARWHRLGASLFDAGLRVEGANVVATSPASTSSAPVLVLMAHLDAKSQRLSLALRIGFLVVSILAAVTLLLVAIAGFLGVAPPPVPLVAALGCAGVAGSLLLATGGLGNASPGALDNASGVALLAGLATTLPATVAGRVRLVFVATGAEELGLGGALRFTQRHRDEYVPSRTLCLNFDTLGGGGKLYLAGARRAVAAVLVRLRRDGHAAGLRVGRLPLILGVGMDHMRLSAAGLEAVSLTQGPGRAMWYVHSARDRAERVDVGQLCRIAGVVSRLAEDIAREGGLERMRGHA